MKEKISRRDFLKLSLAALGGAALACGGQGRENDRFFGVTPLPFFLAMTGMKQPESPQALAQLEKVLNNPEQLDNLLVTLNHNKLSVSEGNIVSDLAVSEGKTIGGSFCSDSRGLVFSKFKAMIFGQSLEDVWMTEARQAGAQPAIFRPNITKSLFVSHEALPGCSFGCGYLGGAEEVLLNGDAGVQKLIGHGVPPETITHILNWKNEYGGSIRFDKLTPDEWAEIGGSIQAYINGKAKGETHMVLFGVQAHGTGEFRPLGFVDETGRTLSLNDGMQLYPELAGASDFLNQPHPAIESLVAGQKPNINILSVSKHSPTGMFGEQSVKPGQAFVVNHSAETISAESLDTMIKELIASQGYSVGALEQRANIIYLTADNATDMAKLRQALLGSSFADDFFKKGGLVIELIADERGLFKPNIVLRNYENPLMILTLSPEEELIAKNGVQKISGAVKLVERADNPNMMTVIVRSAKDGKDYSLQIPKTAGYSGITAEILESAGLPIAEASKFEQFFVKCGGIFGKGLLVAGLIWMTVDGLKYINDDLMNRGEYVQLNPSSEIEDLPAVNNDIANSISKLGIVETAAYTFYKKDTKQIDDILFKRVGDGLAMADVGHVYDPSFLLKLDANQKVVPLVVSDNDVDYYTPIKVTPQLDWNTVRSDSDGHNYPTITGITFENTLTHEMINLTKNADGKFDNVSTKDSLKFPVLVNSPTGEMYSIPFKFHLSDDLQNIIAEPDYFSETTSMTPPQKYSVPDIASYQEEWGKFAYFFRAMDKVLSALS